MERTKVPIPAGVMKGLEAVRLSGKTNMFDLAEVVGIAAEMDFFDTAMWIESNRSLYCQGLIQGFEPTDERSDD